MTKTPPKRCPWCEDDPLYVKYHDTEWGLPVHDDNMLFEFLILEGMQATGMVNDHEIPCFRFRETAKNASVRARRAAVSKVHRIP